MRELTSDERGKVNGGLLPVLAAIGSFLGHTSVRTVGMYYASRATSVYGVYSAAASLKDN